jgi:hypothetical protein
MLAGKRIGRRIAPGLGKGPRRRRATEKEVGQDANGIRDQDLAAVIDIEGAEARRLRARPFSKEEVGERANGIAHVDLAVAIRVSPDELHFFLPVEPAGAQLRPKVIKGHGAEAPQRGPEVIEEPLVVRREGNAGERVEAELSPRGRGEKDHGDDERHGDQKRLAARREGTRAHHEASLTEPDEMHCAGVFRIHRLFAPSGGALRNLG